MRADLVNRNMASEESNGEYLTDVKFKGVEECNDDNE